MLNRGRSQPIRSPNHRANQSVLSKCHSETHSRSTPYCYNGYKFQVLVIVKEGNLGCYLAVVEGLITLFFEHETGGEHQSTIKHVTVYPRPNDGNFK